LAEYVTLLKQQADPTKLKARSEQKESKMAAGLPRGVVFVKRQSRSLR
jgi:hypothetical protein